MAKFASSPFDTIESAHDFVSLLSKTLGEAKLEISADVEREGGGSSNRRRDALLIAAYNLERLEVHLAKSARLLNDLRSIRRLLFEERSKSGKALSIPQAKPAPHTAAVPKNGHPVAAA